MKKKPLHTGKRLAAAPESAQLNAVRKLSHAGRHEEAQARVAELRARYPDFKPLLALAWEINDNAGNFFFACLHAWDWSTASPASLAALEALRDSAFDADLPALAASAMQRLADAEGKPFPDLPLLPGEPVPLTFAEAVAVDLSRLLLSAGRFDEVIATLQGVGHPAARNNLALARFAQGDIAAALAGADANWRLDGRNLFALHQLVRLRLWTGGRGPACELADALRDTQALRPADAYGKMFGLLLLGEYDEAIDAWRSLRNAIFWMQESPLEQSNCAYFAGLAALLKGDRKAAGKLFFEARDLNPDHQDAAIAFAAMTLHAPDAEAELKAGAFHDWFPQSWIAAFHSTKGEHAREALLEAQYRHCDAHPDYLAAAAELGGEAAGIYAMSVLKSRAVNGDAAARDMLHSLLVRPCGPDSLRLDLDAWLRENGLVEMDQPQRLLIKGEIQELVIRSTRVHAEQRDLGLPPASQTRLEQLSRLLAQADLHGALRIAEALAVAHPEHPTMIANIATIRDALGHDLDEVETLFQRAAALDPGYLFALAGLASIAARKGEPERAQELLKPLKGREEYHYSDWRAILTAERAIAMAQHDMALVSDLDEALAALEEQFS